MTPRTIKLTSNQEEQPEPIANLSALKVGDLFFLGGEYNAALYCVLSIWRPRVLVMRVNTDSLHTEVLDSSNLAVRLHPKKLLGITLDIGHPK